MIGCEGNSQRVFFVMLMPSHSHRVTIGHIEFNLPIGFPLSQASEVLLQGQTVLNWIYVSIQDTVVREQANRRPGENHL